MNEPASIDALSAAREQWRRHRWQAGGGGTAREIVNPAVPSDVVGEVREAGAAEVAAALVGGGGRASRHGRRLPATERAAALRRAADAYEDNVAELTALATREAGKSLADAISEVREAVDFLRYYANQAEVATGEPRGVMVCISPWNFPLAIFSGQVAACLGAGNAVIAKPAEQTPLIAARAVELMHAAGVPEAALQLLPGDGPAVGAPLTAAKGIAGVCFTGSTEVAQAIHRALAENAAPDAVLIAETGGLNAMVVDSTALTEQVVRDVLASAFQSAGQRCSALRVLYVQKEARARVLEMLTGAMDALKIGDPWDAATDVGPVIDAEAQDGIGGYLEEQAARGAVHETAGGAEARPVRFARGGRGRRHRRGGARDLRAGAACRVVPGDRSRQGGRRGQRPRLRADLRAAQPDRRPGGAGDRAAACRQRLREPQPDRRHRRLPAVRRRGVERHRAEGRRAVLSQAPAARTRGVREPAAPEGPEIGTAALASAFAALDAGAWAGRPDRLEALRAALGAKAAEALDAAATLPGGPVDLPGPTGESNRLSLHPRGRVLCLGAGTEAMLAQTVQALAAGNAVLAVADGATAALKGLKGMPVTALDGRIAPEALEDLPDLALVAAAGPTEWLRGLRRALSRRSGPIVPLETAVIAPERYVVERHLCIDTTAAGGNASLLAASA